MELPLIRDPETGDPIGFIIDVEGRYVERVLFEFESLARPRVIPRTKGLEPGDQVFLHGRLVHTEMQPIAVTTPRGPAAQEELRRIMEKINDDERGVAGFNSNHGPRWHWGGEPVDIEIARDWPRDPDWGFD